MPSNPYLIDRPARIAFSGGRTSGYMLFKIRQAFGNKLPDDVIVTFANTGKECEETLEFVRDCSRNWAVPIRWVEYRRDQDAPTVIPGKRPLIGCHSFAEVTFETADRTGTPFETVIDVKADFRREAKDEPPVLPNPTDRWCSGELKHRTMDRFMQSLGFEAYTVAVGLRADEPKRVANMRGQSTRRIDYVCPLASAGVVERDVMAFWKSQLFDLKLEHDPELGTYAGNCDGCFLKNSKKLGRLLVERPEFVDWWAEQEERTGQTFRRDRENYRKMADRRVRLAMCERDDDDLGACLCTD